MAPVLAWSAPAEAQGEDDDGERRANDTGSVPSGSSGAVVKKPKPGPKPAKAKIVPPKLVKFEAAPYPAEAKEKNIQGDVILELTIGKDGAVSEAKAVEGLGHGLDEAAEAAALEFVFEPATRDGKPIPVKIRYKYSFTLTPEETPEDPANSGEPPPPPPGNIGGVLRIAGTKSPLVGAQIKIKGPEGLELTATTDLEGVWIVEGLTPGKYDVEISAAGFVSGSFPFEIESGKAYEFEYALPPEVQGEEVTIQGVRPPRSVTKRTVQRREINRIPGTSGDALRSIQSLPGVARPPGLAGLLIVRGSAPQDTQTFIDGNNVPLIYHFGGLSSVVPTELLDRIDFYPGNFSAKYGRVQGGIVDVALREPDTSCTEDYGKPSEETGCYHGMAQVDLIDVRILAQGPLFGAEGWSFAVGGRRSWFDTWLKPVLEEAGAGVTSAPVYSDYQFIVENKSKDNSRLSLRFYGSSDELEIIINDPAAQDPAFGGNVQLATSFFAGQVLYETDLTDDVSLNTMMAAGNNSFEFGLGQFVFDLNVTPIYTRSELAFKIMKGGDAQCGHGLLARALRHRGAFPPAPSRWGTQPGPVRHAASVGAARVGCRVSPGLVRRGGAPAHRSSAAGSRGSSGLRPGQRARRLQPALHRALRHRQSTARRGQAHW